MMYRFMGLLALSFLITVPLQAQQEEPDFEREGVRLGGVLGIGELSPEDQMIAAVVQRMEFESYVDLIRGLAEFGDREQGTPRNEAANDWIEAQLQSWGYETERIRYEYEVRRRGQPSVMEPREEVYATKVGADPSRMYILGAHMDGRGGGEAVNDDASGTALVMEVARSRETT